MSFEQPGEFVLKLWQLVGLLLAAFLLGVELGHWVFLLLLEVIQ